MTVQRIKSTVSKKVRGPQLVLIPSVARQEALIGLAAIASPHVERGYRAAGCAISMQCHYWLVLNAEFGLDWVRAVTLARLVDDGQGLPVVVPWGTRTERTFVMTDQIIRLAEGDAWSARN